MVVEAKREKNLRCCALLEDNKDKITDNTSACIAELISILITPELTSDNLPVKATILSDSISVIETTSELHSKG